MNTLLTASGHSFVNAWLNNNNYLILTDSVLILVISHGATFKEIESDWDWLTKYLLETLGKSTTENSQSTCTILYLCCFCISGKPTMYSTHMHVCTELSGHSTGSKTSTCIQPINHSNKKSLHFFSFLQLILIAKMMSEILSEQRLRAW